MQEYLYIALFDTEDGESNREIWAIDKNEAYHEALRIARINDWTVKVVCDEND